MVRRTRDHWGRREANEESWRVQWPSAVDNPGFMEALTVATLATASPGAAAEFRRAVSDADVTDILPAIRVPTLVLYRKLESEPFPGARGLEAEARQIGAAIPDAHVVALEGPDHPAAAGPEVTAEVERFLHAPSGLPVPDRVLATILFTDLVGSTERRSRSATKRGATCSAGIETPSGRSSVAFGVRRWIRPATVSLPPSTGRRERLHARRRSSPTRTRSGSSCARVSTPGNASVTRANSRASPCTSAPASPRALNSGEILVSSTVKDLTAGSGIEFADRGEHQLKGIPSRRRLFQVRDVASD
jgi:hypothetical protein